MEYVQEFIKPQLLILVPVLYFIGIALKKSAKVADKNIPLTLSAIGVIMSMVYVLSTAEAASFNLVMTAIFTAITQGVLCAGASVFVNQVVKQYSGDKSSDDDAPDK